MRRPGSITVYVSAAGAAHVIPNRAFRNRHERNTFWLALQQHWQSGRGQEVCKIVIFWVICMSVSAAPIGDEECLKFFHQSVAQQISQFKLRNLEEQYQLFICVNQKMHPPASYLDETFAERGVEIIPYLQKKLQNINNELTIRDIGAILIEYKRLNKASIVDDEVVILFEQKWKAMRGPWKEIVGDQVDSLKSRH